MKKPSDIGGPSTARATDFLTAKLTATAMNLCGQHVLGRTGTLRNHAVSAGFIPPFVIQMPKLGHTMTEGTVLKLHKHPGDNVREGELVLTVETDKAEVEIESPAAGVLARVLADDGMVVDVGLPLGEILRAGETASESPVGIDAWEARIEQFGRSSSVAAEVGVS